MKPKKKKVRKNSNYKTGLDAVAQRYVEYKYLRRQPGYILLLDMEQQSKPVGYFICRVLEQLDKCIYTGGMYPDYNNFRESLSGYLSNERLTDAMAYKVMTNGAMQYAPTNDQAILLLAAVYYGATQSVVADFSKEPDKKKLMAMGMKYWGVLDKFKLLQGLYENKERFYALMKSMTGDFSIPEDGLPEFGDEISSPQDLMKRLHDALNTETGDFSIPEGGLPGFGDEISSPQDLMKRLNDALNTETGSLSVMEAGLLEFGDEIPSPQELMKRLNYALNMDLKDAANRLVGMLQMVRDKLDPGEFAYFSAMVYMKESDLASLDKAYREVKKIPETAAEYVASRGMLAEILARKGDPAAFLEIFNYAKYIGHFAMRCYVQQLIRNIPSQSFSAADERALGKSVVMKQLNLVSENFNRCYPEEMKVTMEEPEYIIFLNNVLEASGEVFRFHQEMGHMAPDGQFTPGSVRRARKLLETTAVPYYEALERLRKDATPENRLAFIDQNVRFSRKCSFTAVSGRCDLTLRAARTFLLDEGFVDLFLHNYSYYEEYFEPRLLRHWLTEAYLTALSCGHPQQAQLREKLDALFPAQDAAFEDDVTYRSIYGMLTDPGKLLYASAESSYRAARDSDYGWKDAGMLSLGFFRLVEVELRQRLLVDVFGKNDPVVRQWLREVEKRKKDEPDNSRIGMVTVGKEKFELSLTLIRMQTPAKMTMEQMEYCFYLLSEQAETAPEWDGYRDALRQKLYSVLSDEGIRASKDGHIARAICQQKRQEFRNPPAHARYLPIEKAVECRDYVNQTILTLCGKWLA